MLHVKPHYEQVWRAPEFSVRVRTNGAGFREDRDFALADVDVAFLGDSFLFGHGVEQDERISDLVARAFPDQLVVSLSYENGFALGHYLVYVERHPELRPRLAVVGVYLGNDLEADEHETRIETDAATGLRHVELPYRSFTRQGYMMVHPSALQPWVRRLRDCCALGRFVVGLLNHSRNRQLIFAPGLGEVVPNAPNSRELDSGTLIPSARTALEHLAELSALIESRGGHLIALLIPQNFYVVRDAQPQGRLTAAEASRLRRKRPLQRAILKWCEQSGVDCLDLTTGLASHPEHEALYFRGDAHWTPLGHRVAADLLLRRLDTPVVATKATTEASSVATAESKEMAVNVRPPNPCPSPTPSETPTPPRDATPAPTPARASAYPET